MLLRAALGAYHSYMGSLPRPSGGPQCCRGRRWESTFRYGCDPAAVMWEPERRCDSTIPNGSDPPAVRWAPARRWEATIPTGVPPPAFVGATKAAEGGGGGRQLPHAELSAAGPAAAEEEAVAMAIAALAGVRPANCKTAVPKRILSVCAAI